MMTIQYTVSLISTPQQGHANEKSKTKTTLRVVRKKEARRG